MARLLILLACARGAAGVMDALDIKAVCEVPTDGGPRKIYLDMDAEAFETLAGPPGPGNAMSLPIEATDCEPFKSAYINFSPGGHPAWDGKGDGYGINHALFSEGPGCRRGVERHRRDSLTGRSRRLGPGEAPGGLRLHGGLRRSVSGYGYGSMAQEG